MAPPPGCSTQDKPFPYYYELKVYIENRLPVPFCVLHMDTNADCRTFEWLRVFSAQTDVPIRTRCSTDECVAYFLPALLEEVCFELADTAEEAMAGLTFDDVKRSKMQRGKPVLDTQHVISTLVSFLPKLKQGQKYSLVWYCCHIDALTTAAQLVATPGALDEFSWSGLCAAEYWLNGKYVGIFERRSGASHVLRKGLVSRQLVRHLTDLLSKRRRAQMLSTRTSHWNVYEASAVSTMAVAVHWKVLTCTATELLFFGKPNIPFNGAAVGMCCATNLELAQSVMTIGSKSVTRFASRCLETTTEKERGSVHMAVYRNDFIELGTAIVQLGLPPYVCEYIVRCILGRHRTQLLPFAETSKLLCNIHRLWMQRTAVCKL